MQTTLPLAIMAAAALFPAPAIAASRNFGVSGFDRVRVEGPFAVTLITGTAPFAKATGSAKGIDGVSIRVEGTTLIISADRSAWSSAGSPAGPVTIAVGTHELDYAAVSGTGSLAIDKVRGLDFSLTVSGAGQASIAHVDIDQFKLALAGSGDTRLAGKAGKFTAIVRGAASLDASGLIAKDLALTAMGPATIKAFASGDAKVAAGGTSTVTLTGSPSCTVKAIGSASVSGCR